MAEHFRPEFLGRLTEIIPFAPINEEMVQKILTIQLKSLYAALEKQGIQLKLTETVIHQLAQKGFTPKYGARPLAGVIRSHLRRPLSAKIISGELSPGNTIELMCDKEGLFEWKVDTTSSLNGNGLQHD